jgi:hypothetical protein
MKYTEKQIEKAKRNYEEMMIIRSVESFDPETIGWDEAENECDRHNKLAESVKEGGKEAENKWKLFFLNQAVKADKHREEIKSKLAANKEASSDVLAPVKEAKRLVEFGKWLNTAGNPFRKQHFNKKYTREAVELFFNS